MASRIVTISLHGIDNAKTILVLDGKHRICRSKEPVQRVLWWSVDTLADLRLSFDVLLRQSNIHTIVMSVEFDPPMDPTTNTEPTPIAWPTAEREVARQWFEAFLYRLDPPLWRELETRTARGVVESVEVPPAPTTDSAARDASVQGEDN